MPTLRQTYQQSLRPALSQELAIANHLAVPRLAKIVVNVGLSDYRLDQKKIAVISENLGRITGQRPSLRRARKAVSSFKLRAGDPVGLSLTLRGKRMYDFFERLTRIALPRVRDFRGIPRRNFDGRGNLSLGIREQTVFPEIRYEDVSELFGLEITIVTTARTDAAAEKLLAALGIPFAK